MKHWKLLFLACATLGAQVANAQGTDVAFSARQAQRAAAQLSYWQAQVATAAPGYANLDALNAAEAQYEFYVHTEW